MNKLKCKMCNYEAKQLFQHFKSVHSIATFEYREKFGKDEIVQLGFLPNYKQKDEYRSKYVRNGYNKINNKIKNVNMLYSKQKTRNILIKNCLWENYIGKAKYRTMINDDVVLYKSICEYAIGAEKIMGRSLSLPEKMKFIVEYNYNTNKLKCVCNKTYTFNKYCRYCTDCKRSQLGKPHKIETIQKMRKSTIKYIKKMNGKCAPRYNINSIAIIEQYGKDHGYNFQHAENGGEYHIKELGYFVDGYDKEKNVVIEVDEKHHFKNGKLKEKDIKRQKEIEEYLGCDFVRIAT